MSLSELLNIEIENIHFQSIKVRDSFVSKFSNYYIDENGSEKRVYFSNQEEIPSNVRKESITVLDFNDEIGENEKGIMQYSEKSYRHTVETRNILNNLDPMIVTNGAIANIKYSLVKSNHNHPENNIKQGETYAVIKEMKYTIDNLDIKYQAMSKAGITFKV